MLLFTEPLPLTLKPPFAVFLISALPSLTTLPAIFKPVVPDSFDIARSLILLTVPSAAIVKPVPLPLFVIASF